jgi:hypothetical protein
LTADCFLFGSEVNCVNGENFRHSRAFVYSREPMG